MQEVLVRLLIMKAEWELVLELQDVALQLLHVLDRQTKPLALLKTMLTAVIAHGIWGLILVAHTQTQLIATMQRLVMQHRVEIVRLFQTEVETVRLAQHSPIALTTQERGLAQDHISLHAMEIIQVTLVTEITTQELAQELTAHLVLEQFYAVLMEVLLHAPLKLVAHGLLFLI
jgi:hypothetical protein